MTTVASLTIEMAANVARLQADMGRAANTVQSATAKMQASAAAATRALGLIGGALSFGALLSGFSSAVKGAIDLADSLNKLSQRTGIATETLSQLQYAAKLADVSSDSLNTGLKKLNVSIASGIAGDKEKVAIFKTLGITLTDVGGGAKTADKVLLELADTFAKAKDGSGKTAAAVALLGKAGDELIPLLNGGSESIRAMQKEADKLGLTIGADFAQKAEEFNDNLTRVQVSSQKLAIALAGDLVEGLGKAVKAMADAALEGGKLAGIIAGIQTLLTGDDRHKNNVAFVKETELLFSAEAALQKARARGDQTQVERLTKAVELRKKDVASVQAYRTLLDEADAKTAAAKKKLDDAKNDAKPITLGGKAAETEYTKLIARITDRISVQALELEQGRELTQAEQFRAKALEDLNAKTLTASASERAAALALIDRVSAQAEAIDFEKNRIQSLQIYFEADRKLIAEYEENTDSLAAQNESLREENELIGLSLREQQAVITLRNAATIAVKELQLAELQRVSAVTGTQSRIEIALEEEIRLLKERNKLQGIKLDRTEAADAYKALRDEGKQFTDDLNRGLTDSLFRAFESGRGFFKNLWDGIRNLFKTTVLRLAINGVVGGIGGGAGGLAQAATGSGLGGLSSLAGLSGLGGSFSSGLRAGFGALLGESGISGALSAGLTSIGTGTGAGIAAGLGTLAGALGPIALGVSALYSYFRGKRGGAKQDGKFGTIYSGIGLGQRTLDPAAQQLALGLQAQYGALTSAFGGTSSVTFGAGISTDPRGTAPSFLDISGTQNGGILFNQVNTSIGRSAEELAAAVAADSVTALIRALRASNLDKPFADFFDSVADDATDAVRQAALKTAQEVQGYTRSFELLGGVFATLKNQTVDARNEFIQLGGGLESLTGKTNSYFQNYYSEAERSAIQTQQLTSQFGALGLALPGTREGLRALVDAQDLGSAAGRRNAAALIGLSDSFSQITGQVDTLFDSIKQNIRDLYGEVDSTRAFSAAEGRAFIDAALANGGPVDATQLGEATAAVRAGFNDFSTQADADFSRLSLAGQLSQLIAPQRQSNEQMAAQLKALQEQMAQMVAAQNTGNDLARRTTNVLEAVVTGNASLSTEAAP